MARPRGFTLVELIISIAVLGVVSVIVVPTYQLVVAQVQLASGVAQLADIIRLQQQRTVSEQRVYGLTLTATTVVTNYNRCTTTGCTATVADSYTTSASVVGTYRCVNLACTTREVELVDVPATVEISQVSLGGSADIRFATTGAPTVTGSVTLLDPVRNRRRDVALRPSGAILTNGSEY